uniref:Transmembrane protein n=1 Tax=Ascaris lumbricoides TaxID=6252 RepID=A0A0M3HH74_ASCLU
NEKYTSIVAYFRTTQRCTVIDARETAPQKAYRDMYLNDEFGSKYAIATPGEIAGYWLAYKRFGSGRISWADLVKPAIDLCRNGVPISEYLGYVLGVKEKHFRTLPSMQNELRYFFCLFDLFTIICTSTVTVVIYILADTILLLHNFSNISLS